MASVPTSPGVRHVDDDIELADYDHHEDEDEHDEDQQQHDGTESPLQQYHQPRQRACATCAKLKIKCGWPPQEQLRGVGGQCLRWGLR